MKAKAPKKTAAKAKAAPKAKTSAKKTQGKKVSTPVKSLFQKAKTALLNPSTIFTNKTKSQKSVSVEFSPLRDFVLIERSPEIERTAGGLYIPGTASEKPMLGRVLSVGPGAVDKKGRKRPLDVKVGDQVLFGKYAGTEIQIDGASFLVLRENDILGVSSEEAN
ncbi:MAG: co-chaperone GroES [Bdellovibrionales bacterium]|nr:co-chaperone GroES [Bdellovibrionales bacterium]